MKSTPFFFTFTSGYGFAPHRRRSSRNHEFCHLPNSELPGLSRGEWLMHALSLPWAHVTQQCNEPGNLSYCPGCSLGIFFYTVLQEATLKDQHWPSRSKSPIIPWLETPPPWMSILSRMTSTLPQSSTVFELLAYLGPHLAMGLLIPGFSLLSSNWVS